MITILNPGDIVRSNNSGKSVKVREFIGRHKTHFGEYKIKVQFVATSGIHYYFFEGDQHILINQTYLTLVK